MSEMFEEREGTPTVEVRVYRDGALVHRELCESEEESAALVEQWAEQEGVECEIDDLSVRHRAGDVLEPDLAERLGEDYPRASQADRGARRAD